MTSERDASNVLTRFNQSEMDVDLLASLDNRLERCINLPSILGLSSMCCDKKLSDLKSFPKDSESIKQVKQHIQHKIMSMRCQLNAFKTLDLVYQKQEDSRTDDEKRFVEFLETWFEMFTPMSCTKEFRSDAALASIFCRGSKKRKAQKAVLSLDIEDGENDTSAAHFTKKRACSSLDGELNSVSHQLEPLLDSCAVRCNTPYNPPKSSPVPFATPEECREAILRNARI